MKSYKSYRQFNEDIQDSRIIASSWKLVKILVENISADLNEIIGTRNFDKSEKKTMTKEMDTLQKRLNILSKKVSNIKEKARDFK